MNIWDIEYSDFIDDYDPTALLFFTLFVTFEL